jgi:hypothetical protein
MFARKVIFLDILLALLLAACIILALPAAVIIG